MMPPRRGKGNANMFDTKDFYNNLTPDMKRITTEQEVGEIYQAAMDRLWEGLPDDAEDTADFDDWAPALAIDHVSVKLQERWNAAQLGQPDVE